jgi:hypothetical protein
MKTADPANRDIGLTVAQRVAGGKRDLVVSGAGDCWSRAKVFGQTAILTNNEPKH